MNDSDDYEIEFVTSSKGVGALMELIRSLKESDLDIFNSLRIANLEKVKLKIILILILDFFVSIVTLLSFYINQLK